MHHLSGRWVSNSNSINMTSGLSSSCVACWGPRNGDNEIQWITTSTAPGRVVFLLAP